MDPGKIFQIITNSTLLATRLLSGAGGGPLEFAEPRYCAVMDEDAQIASPVVTVSATHKQGAEVRYSITGGNKDGLFTIDQRSGLITLAAALDYEIHDKHELVVAAESGGGEAVRAIVQVRVQDVNDNAPYFLHPDPVFTVIEEDDRDLPTTITTVRARDKDAQDKRGLLYTLRGDGVDGYTPADAFFTINPRTGELIQLRALDRDPPRGRQVWKVRVQVRDAQVHWLPEGDDLFLQVLQGAQNHHLPQARVQRDIGRPSEGELSGIISERRDMEGDFDGLVAVKVSSGGKEMEDGKTSIEKITAVEHPAGQSAPQDSLGIMYSWDSRSEWWGLLTAGEKHRNGNRQKIGQYIGSKNTVSKIPLHIRKQNHEIFRNFPVSPEEGRGLGPILHRVSSPQKKQGRYKSLPSGPTGGVGERNVQYYHENTETKSSAESLTRVAKPSIHPLSGYNAKDTPHNSGQLANHENHPIDVRTTEPTTSIASTDHIFNQQNLLIITNDNRVSLNKIPNINKGWKGRTLSSWRIATAKRSLRQGRRSSPSFISGSTISLNTTSTTKTSVSSESNAKEIEERNVVRKLNRIVTKSPNTQSTPVEDASDNIRIMDSFPTSAMNNLTLGTKTEPEYSEYSWLSHPEQKFSTSSWSSEPASGLKTPLSSFALQKFAHGTEMNIYHEDTYRKTLAQRYRKVNGTFSPVSNQPELALSRQGNLRELHSTLLTKEKSMIVNNKSKRNSESIARLSRDALVGDDSRRRFVADSRSAIAQEFYSDSSRHGKSSRGPRGVFITPNDHYGMDDSGEGDGGGGGGGCEDVTVFGGELQNKNMTGGGRQGADDGPGGRRRGGRIGRVHVVETVVTLLVKDINDNPPVFPNTTMFGEVQENGPIDLSVGVISAWDADDTTEGTNARLTYSIEKNVIHERTGEAIFTVDPQSGLIKTALCCLDRETTPEYHIQVVASDGGGLKGTGTVVVRLADVNDNSPRLARQLWELEVDETWGDGPPDNITILEISAADRDTSNYFFYRVVETSGWGWEHFSMRSVGVVGQLYATKTLDYENETHRRGFKFMVQVTDRGRGGWTDPRHLDAAWVSVRLRDVNDNPPVFRRPHAHVTVREDAAPGTLLIALPASDPDMGGIQEVSYKVKGGWDALTVDAEGGVSLWRALDREAPDGAIGVAQIISVDRGMPPLSATATLTITVTDVNDCPPRLLPPTLLHVAEAGPPTLLGVLTATDHDVWALGHGPPFNLSLAPTNPAYVLSHVSLTFDSHLDSGRGGAELWTVRAVDREQHPQLLVEVWAADAQGLSVTHTVTVVIDDLNDNPMKPAAKTVYLWKTQGGGPDAPLGRVYVDDPDDWDLADKTFRWVGSPHPLFSLNPEDGSIFASSLVREGRYELQFAVSDRVWGQRGVAANVTVAVKVLTPDALAHAAPVTLTPTTPADLTRGWTPTEGGGRLGRVIEAIRRVIGESSHTVDVVSVYGHPHNPPPHTPRDTLQGDHTVVASSSFAPDGDHEFDAGEFEGSWGRPSACVWVSVREAGGGFMDPVKLQGLLALNTGQLEERTHLTVVAEDAAAGRVEPQDPLQDHALPTQEEEEQQQQQPSLPSTLGFGIESEPSSAATRASTALPLQVVDTNVTSLVTPRLTRAHACHAHEPESCTPISCLNGGGCLRTSGGNRCVCPEGSVGPRCKVLARTFSGAGWAWVRPLPPCLPLTVSFRVLTRRSHALLLFSGPLAPHPRRPHSPPTPMLAVQLWEGRPQVVLEGGGSPLKLEVNTTVNDGDWHLLHLHLNAQGVSVMVDLCGQGWHDRSPHDSHCVTRAEWALPTGGEAWAGSPPLQVGGLAHAPPRPDDHGWVEAPTARPLEGCVSHLTLNGQLVDLGEPAYSQGSVGGCHNQDAACPGGLGGCGRRGKCVGGLLHPQCECDPGWSGLGCATQTTPAALGKSSYMKVALSFTPAPRVVTVQLRVRTRGPRNGLLLQLAAPHRAAAFTLHLRAGVACVSVSGAGWAARAACVEGRPVGDGAWHTIVAERHGHNLAVSVDDGDGWRRNESLVSLLQGPGTRDVRVSPAPLEVDRHDGVTVGGLPEFAGVSLVTVHDDLSDSCIDDLRVSGRPLPLPPAVNGTSWGQVTTSERLTRGCPAPDACVNTTCAPPLSCTSTWGRATCSCGTGGQLVDDTVCEDVDECLWRPCLHGGSCYNLRPGYLCVCGPGRTGDNCEWGGLSPDSHPFTAPVAIAALTLSLFLLVVVGVVFSIRLHRQWLGRALAGRQVGDVGGVGGEEGTIIAVKGGMEEDSGSIRLKEDPEDTFLNCLKYNHLQAHPPTQRKEESPARPESSSHHTLVKEPSAAGDAARVRAVDAAPEPLLPKDDLRAYAYEGDGSSAGSLSSAISGLKAELDDDGNMKPLVSEFLEVMDLLRNLPEASKSPSLLTKLDRKSGLQGSGTPAGPDMPPTPRSSITSSTPTACGASPAHRRETRHTPPRHASSPRSKEELSTAC